MKEKIFNTFIIIISLFVLIELFIRKKIIYLSVMYALNMWVKSLIPTLFPFFIIADILINYNIINYIPRIFKIYIKKLFNINEYMMTIFLLSMISGFPSNARNTRTLYDKGLINIDEANHILIFTHFANPIFIINIVGIFFLNNQKIGLILLISHYISNIIIGICIRKNNKYREIVYIKNNNNNFGNIFINAIKRAIDTILLICGILVIFLMLSSIINNIFNFNIYNTMIIKGIFEITIGIEALGKLKLSLIRKAVIASMILAFGGISVHMQVISQITETKIQYKYFFMGRIYQMIISGILTYFLCFLFNI